MSARPFDGFEVHLVAEHHNPAGDWCETIDTPGELELIKREYPDAKLFYTVYGHRGWGDDPANLLPDGGAEAISDFPIYQYAIELATALADGKPVTDMVVDTTIGL